MMLELEVEKGGMKIKLEEHFEGSARLVLNFDMREQFYCWD
jgi:hypothetical protein